MGSTSSVRRSKPAMGYLMGEFNRLKSHGVDGEAVWGRWFQGCSVSMQLTGVSLPQAYTHVEEPVLTLSSLRRLSTPEEPRCSDSLGGNEQPLVGRLINVIGNHVALDQCNATYKSPVGCSLHWFTLSVLRELGGLSCMMQQ
eukprot:Skav223802  [mRNA]  locus=scaffold575:633216:637308:- [translate_table: standard]